MKKNRCEFRIVFLPKLNLITPTLETNLAKMTKELGRVAESVGKHRNLNGETNSFNEKEVLDKMILKVLDLMQTCNTMMDLLEENYKIDVDKIFKEHVRKLALDRKYITEDAVYKYDELLSTNQIINDNLCRIVALPKLNLLTPSIESNLIKMVEELGEVSECVENYLSNSEENTGVVNENVLKELGKETLDVMQTCNTMLTSLECNHGIDIKNAIPKHVTKLVNKKYVTKEVLDKIK